jgi:hypothetical protein
MTAKAKAKAKPTPAPTPNPTPTPPPAPAPGWAVGYVAYRPAAPSGASLPEIRHGVEMIAADDEMVALRTGLAHAVFKLPVSAGWTGHEAVSCPSDMRLKPEGDWR